MHCVCVLVGFRTRNEKQAEANVNVHLEATFPKAQMSVVWPVGQTYKRLCVCQRRLASLAGRGSSSDIRRRPVCTPTISSHFTSASTALTQSDLLLVQKAFFWIPFSCATNIKR